MHPQRSWRVVVQVQRCLHTNGAPLVPHGLSGTPSPRVRPGGTPPVWVGARTRSSRSWGQPPLIFAVGRLFPSEPGEEAHDAPIAQANLHPWNPWRGPCASCPPSGRVAESSSLTPPSFSGQAPFSPVGIDTNSTWLPGHRYPGSRIRQLFELHEPRPFSAFADVVERRTGKDICEALVRRYLEYSDGVNLLLASCLSMERTVQAFNVGCWPSHLLLGMLIKIQGIQ